MNSLGYSCDQCRHWCCSVYCPKPCLDKCFFRPPYPRNYDFTTDTEDPAQLQLKVFNNSRCCPVYESSLQECLEVFYVESRFGNSLACLYVNLVANPRCVILLSHANGDDLGTCSQIAYVLAGLLKGNVLCYDYSGYGMSSGRCSENNLYADSGPVQLHRFLKLKLNFLDFRSCVRGPVKQVLFQSQSSNSFRTEFGLSTNCSPGGPTPTNRWCHSHQRFEVGLSNFVPV